MDEYSINPALGIRQPLPVEKSPNPKEAAQRKQAIRDRPRERKDEAEAENGQGKTGEEKKYPEKEQGKIIDVIA
jgi:predicted phage gp36 major capsid-like protein